MGEREVKVAVPVRTGDDGGSGGREVEVEGGRGTWPRAACEAEAGNVQRAESVHVRDCRAAREGQLGREGQGTESCGMPDAAAASAGWSHGHTVCTWPGVESASGCWGHGGIRNWMAGVCLTPDFREDQDQEGPLVTARDGGRERGQKPQRVTAPGEGEGEAPAGEAGDVNQESHSPIVNCRVGRSWSTLRARSGRRVGCWTPCSVAGLPVRSGTSTSGLSTAEAVSGTRRRDGELCKDNRRAVLEDGR